MPITFESVKDPYGLRQAGSTLANALNESIQNRREIEREGRAESREDRQYQLNRQRAIESIGPLKDMDLQGKSPAQTVAAYAEALANVPGGSQILSEILPVVLRQGQNNAMLGGQGSQGMQGGMASGGISAPGGNNILEQILQSPGMQQGMQQGGISPEGEGVFGRPQLLNNTSPVTPPPRGGPETTSFDDILLKASQSPDPMLTLDYYAKEQRLGTEKRQELYSRYQNEFEAESNKIAREEQFREFTKGATADKKYSSDDINRLTRYSEKYSNEPSLTRRLYHAQKDLEKFNNAVSTFEKSRTAPGFMENLFRGKGPAMEQIGLAIKPLLELGEIDLAKRKVSDLGFGPLDTERMVNPLSKDAVKEIKSAPNAIKTNTFGRPDSAGSAKISKQLQEKRRDQVEGLSNNLSKIIKSSPPNTSLKLLRDAFIKDKGYSETEVNYAMNQAIEKGLKLSDIQKSELPELGRTQQRRSLFNIFLDEGEENTNEIFRTLRGYE